MAAIAPMDLVAKTDPASIPLKCTLCPKRPNFSDVSHLLTHISSKSHLSHRFKAELRSHTEREAQEAIRQYEDWYERYGIRGLLAERMAAKDQKKTTKRGRSSKADAAAVTKQKAVPKRRDTIKIEPEDFAEETPALSPWLAGPHRPPGHARNPHRGYFDSSEYRTPILKRAPSDFSADTPDNMSHRLPHPKYRRWPSETETESAPASDLVCDEPEEDEDLGKLKGIRYPGMGLFDSANEQAKRRRNQRKDESVLRLMEQTSETIEPTEYIWNEIGDFQRTRDIYATPSIEGSPDRSLEEDEDNTQKKKKSRRLPTSATWHDEKPRKTRFSTRLAKHKAEVKARDVEDEDFLDNEDDYDAPGRPSHSHASVESYDPFLDRPKSGRDRSESPLRRRSALNPMNVNSSIASDGTKTAKPHQYFPAGDSNTVPFSSHLPVSGNPYFQHQHSMGGGTYNPLYVQTRNGMFHPFSFAAFGTEPKVSTSSFQPINGAVNPNLAGMSYHSYQAPYGDESTHQRGNGGFDI